MRRIISDRMDVIPLSGIREIYEKARTIPDVIRLEFGEPDFDTPQHIKDAAAMALTKGATKYTSSYGIPELRSAVAEKMARENGVNCTSDNVVIASGATSALSIAFLAVMNPGDEVLIPDPGWANYGPIARISGAVPVSYKLVENEDFRVDIDDVRNKISAKTKMILINSPSNPTGGVINEDGLRQIGELATKKDLLILTDEVYEKFVYDGERHVSIGSFRQFGDRVITINSFSKTYAMTGWRLGYCVASEEVVEAMGRLNSSTNSCTPTISQYAGVAALMESQQCVSDMIDVFARRRKILLDGLMEIPLLSCRPSRGAFYAFVNISKTGYSSNDLSMKLLTSGHVATVPGIAFGVNGEGYIRIAYANSEEKIELALAKIKQVLSS